MAAMPQPEGYHTVTPYLVVKDAERLIEFLVAAFGAQETERLAAPNHRIAHAELRIGDSVVMLGEARDGHKERPCMLYVYVSDADATWQRAVASGATAGQQPQDQFYGDRSGSVTDPCGNEWWIATRIENVPPEELHRRIAALMQQAEG
ncbi:MAG TPA: VOC family protein [Acetobacteraceae bacterium]|nr:VOC family protein [Acetobacteraceae bacterium]